MRVYIKKKEHTKNNPKNAVTDWLALADVDFDWCFHLCTSLSGDKKLWLANRTTPLQRRLISQQCGNRNDHQASRGTENNCVLALTATERLQTSYAP